MYNSMILCIKEAINQCPTYGLTNLIYVSGVHNVIMTCKLRIRFRCMLVRLCVPMANGVPFI